MAKTALVTGHQGFIGSHMIKELTKRGYRVLGVDKSAVDDAKRFFARSVDRFDLVVHAAYVVGGRATIDGTNTALIENTLLDSMLFDWALRTKQKSLLYFSSSAAYPTHLQDPTCNKILREDDIRLHSPYPPDANYGWAKLTGEKMAKVYAENGGRVHVVRPFSGYSEDQSLDYPFPSIVRRATSGDFVVWGPKGQTRDWTHVDDVINGALAIVDNDVRDPVNLCTGIGTEMGQLMKMVVARWTGYDVDITYDESKPTGVFYRVGDPTKLHQFYQPTITIEEGVSRAIAAARG